MRNRGFAQSSSQESQVLIERSLRRVEILAAVSLPEHFVEMSLCIPQSAVDGLIQILSLLGFEVAAAIYSHQPSTRPRRMIWPTFRAIETPPPVRSEKLAHGVSVTTCFDGFR
jgi:hypothetical protein